MATITSDLVQQLRAKTGAGMMECKRALETAGGDVEQAIKILREKGAASAAKRAGNATQNGLVTFYLKDKTAVLLEVNCETDFVERTPGFQSLLSDLGKLAAEASPAWASPKEAPQSRIEDAQISIKENITFRRFTRYDRQGAGVFGIYIHPSGDAGKVGVLLELGATSDKAASSEDVKTLARSLAMQVAAAMPKWVRREDVPAGIVEQEKAIGREQAKRDNKPEKIWDKIVEGKLNQFYQQFCLLEQPYVRDPGGKTLVKTVVEQASAAAGEPLTVRRFVRYKVGEEE